MDDALIPYAISTPDGKLVPGYITAAGEFTDLDGRVWVAAEDGTWTPPAEHLER